MRDALTSTPSQLVRGKHGLLIGSAHSGLVLLGVSALLASGCSDVWATTCLALAMCDPAAPPPVVVDVVCDDTPAASCTPQTFAIAIDTILASVIPRSASSINVWGLGSDAAHLQRLGGFVVPTAPLTSPAQLTQWQEHVRDSARKELVAVFPAQTSLRTSPIAGSLSVLALAHVSDKRQHIIYAVTDGLEQTDDVGHFECGTLPTVPTFTRRLAQHALLTPGSLKGVGVVFAFMRLRPVDRDRCHNDVQRATQVRALWLSALSAAGAVPVVLSPEVSPLPIAPPLRGAPF